MAASLLPYDEAFARITSAVRSLDPEMLALDDAVGHILAEDMASSIDVPQRALSAMDGFAVRDRDLLHLPVSLPIAARCFPGDAGMAMPDGGCVAVFTGSPVPAGADRVIVQERVVCENGAIRLAEPPPVSRNIRAIASDVRRGQVIMKAGTLIGPLALVALAGCDRGHVPVVRRPRLAILSTGDELVPVGTARDSPRGVPQSLSAGLAALARQWGAGTVRHGHLPDRAEAVRHGIAEALAEADCVVVIGGASVGERDFARRAATAAGVEPCFAGIAMRPGKPAWFGLADGCPVLGLPGNPAAAMTVARLLLAPLIAALAGRDASTAAAWRVVRVDGPTTGFAGADFFARAQSTPGGLRLLDAQQSSGQAGLAMTDTLVRIRAGVLAVVAGEHVEALMF